MHRVGGGSLRRTSGIEEVVIVQRGAALRGYAAHYRQPAEIVGRQQVGGFRGVASEWLERTNRRIDNIEAVIRVGKDTTDSGDREDLRILPVRGRAISQLEGATYPGTVKLKSNVLAFACQGSDAGKSSVAKTISCFPIITKNS